MLDTSTERVLTLAQAADELPRRRRGRKCHVSTLFRWTTAGCRGVVLESVQIGATRCTSGEALARFFQRLTEARDGAQHQPAPVVGRTEAQRLRDSQRAGRRLEQLGA